MTTSVVIVGYRPHQWLARSVASVVEEADEVIVVDNGSADRAVGVIGRDAGAQVVTLRRNTGFPAGVNAGLAAARGEVIALLNDDAFARPGWLDAARSAIADPATAVVSPKITFALPWLAVRFPDEARRVGDDHRLLGRRIRSVTAAGREVLPLLQGPGVHPLESDASGSWRWTSGQEPVLVPLGENESAADVAVDGRPLTESAELIGERTLINNAGGYLSAHGYGGDHGYAAVDDGRFDQPAERFAACGAAFVTRRDVFDRVGTLPGHFFAYYEDLDWSWRVRLAGLRIAYDPAGHVEHVGGVTSGGPAAARVQGLAARNRLLCLLRNAPASVARAEIRRTLSAEHDRRLVGRVAAHVPRALVERRRLSSTHAEERAAVWERWAGADETW